LWFDSIRIVISVDFTVCFPVDLDDLKAVIGKLQSRIDKLESHVKILEDKCGVASPTVPCGGAAPKTAPAAPAAKDEVVDGDDENVDLFGSDSEVCLACKWVEFVLFILKGKNSNMQCNFHNPHSLGESTVHSCSLNQFWKWGDVQATYEMQVVLFHYLIQCTFISILVTGSYSSFLVLCVKITVF
jgi:hypothetical protein